MKREQRGFHFRPVFLAALALGSMFARISATCYYIDASGGSDANIGTTTTLAWKTLASLNVDKFKAGDSLLLKRGVQWKEGLCIRSAGSPQKPLFVGAFGNGAAPVIDDSMGKSGYGIELLGSWTVVESLFVKNGATGGIFITKYSDSSIVRNCEVTASGVGTEVQGRHNLVKGNYFHDLTMVVNTPGGTDDYGAVGVLLENSANEICYNRMIRCKASSYDWGTDGGVIELYGNSDTCLIHHNISDGCDGFVEVGGGSSKGTRISYNISINNGQLAWVHLNDQFASVVQDLRMENNTIVDTVSGGKTIWTLIGFVGTASPGMFLFRNNIVYVKNFSFIANANSASNGWSFTHTNNLYYLDSSIIKLGLTLDATEEVADPLFINYADTNFHLKPGSPAVSAGIPLGYPFDFYNCAVPTVPSLGAVQYATTVAGTLASHRSTPRTRAAFLGRNQLYITGKKAASSYTVSGRRVSTVAVQSKMPLER